MADLNCIKPVPCVPEVDEKEIYPPATPAFSFCAGKYTIAWDGTRLRAEETNIIPDGEYDTVTVADGCIVGYGNGASPTYTPPYCNPNPAPCGEGSGSAGGYSVSPQVGNILEDSALGLYARSYVQGGTGIAVAGNGTEANPYKITSSVWSGITQITSNNPHISIDNTVATAPSVGMAPTGFAAGVYAGFAIDRFGIVTGYTEDSGDVVSEVMSGLDIQVSSIGGTYTVSHATTLAGNTTIQAGAYEMRFSGGGHVESATRNITVESGIYAIDGWLFTVNTYGAITNIASDPTPPPQPSMAIIDIIELTYSTSGDSYSIQGLSTQQPTNAGGNGLAYSFTMPPYVRDISQITVIGGAGVSIGLTESIPVKVDVTSLATAGANVKFVIRGA